MNEGEQPSTKIKTDTTVIEMHDTRHEIRVEMTGDCRFVEDIEHLIRMYASEKVLAYRKFIKSEGK